MINNQRNFRQNSKQPQQSWAQKNYGLRVDGPWIFGQASCHIQEDGSYKTGQVRLFWVQHPNRQTLVPICNRNVEPGSRIWSNERRAYSSLGDRFINKAMNHSVEQVKRSKVRSHKIKQVCKSLKFKLMKRMNETSRELIQTHLAEFCRRCTNECSKFKILEWFLDSASMFYPIAL